MRKHKHKMYFCMQCLGHFHTQEVLDKHIIVCGGEMCRQVITMPPENSILKFKNVRYQQTCPFVIYADFESMTADPKVPFTSHQTGKAAALAVTAAEEVEEARRANLPCNNPFGWNLDEMIGPEQHAAIPEVAAAAAEGNDVENQTQETLLDSELLDLDDDNDDFEDENDQLNARLRKLRAHPTQAYQCHVVCSAGLVVVSTLPDINVPYEQFFGEDQDRCRNCHVDHQRHHVAFRYPYFGPVILAWYSYGVQPECWRWPGKFGFASSVGSGHGRNIDRWCHNSWGCYRYVGDGQ
jgi:hypothetical protein